MLLILLVFFLGKKKDYFKTLKYRDYPKEESTFATSEITHLKSLMTEQTEAKFKVELRWGFLWNDISNCCVIFLVEVLTESHGQDVPL